MSTRPTATKANAARPTRRALVVIGCHRSGTSAMARALSLCGAELPAGLIGAAEGNPKGHWEPSEVGRLNDDMLRSIGSGWNSIFGPSLSRLDDDTIARTIEQARAIVRSNYSRDLIVFKDPRVSVLMPIWRPALEQEGYELCPVVMLRHPADVAESLFLRDALPRHHGVVLWMTYLLSLEAPIRDLARCYVSYADLAADAEAQLDRVEQAFGGGLLNRSWGALLDVEAFLDEAREFNPQAERASISLRFADVVRYHDHLLRLARDEPTDPAAGRRAAEWWSAQLDTWGPIVRGLEPDAYAQRDQRSGDIGRY